MKPAGSPVPPISSGAGAVVDLTADAVEISNEEFDALPANGADGFAKVPTAPKPTVGAVGAAQLKFGVTDKKSCRTGYFEYKIGDDGRIWSRYAPTLAPKAFTIAVTEPPPAAALHAKLAKMVGPYTYTYDEKRRLIVVTPRPDAATKGYVLRDGRLAEVDRKEATRWHLHDGKGGPDLPEGVTLTDLQVSGEIIAARGSDNVLYLYKPTIKDEELPVKWSSDNGTPFGGALHFPKMRDWAFGLSVGVKPSERATLEMMNPYTCIDNFYHGADGGKAFYGFTATVGVLSESGREIRYWDTGLPPDLQRGFTTPERGRVVGEKLSQAGSTWLLLGRDQGKPGLWFKGYDHEMLGSCPGLRYTFDEPQQKEDRIADLAEAQRFVPLPPWQRLEFPELEGQALVTDRVSIHNCGQGNSARRVSIEGRNADGVTGYFEKTLSQTEWRFVATNQPLLGKPIALNSPLVPDTPLAKDYPDGAYEGFAGVPIDKVTLHDFHPFQTLDEASHLRFTLLSGKTVDVRLRTSDAYSPWQHDALDDEALAQGIGAGKPLTGTLQIPEALRQSKDPEVQALVRRLQPYHHVPNLFVINADIDHVEISTDGRYRKSDQGFDYASAPPCALNFTRDARGESLFEKRALALKPSAAMTRQQLKELVAANFELRRQIDEQAEGRAWRNTGMQVKVGFLDVVTKTAFFFMNLFGMTKKEHLGPISDIVPRFMDGHGKAHETELPVARLRAQVLIDQNIVAARDMRKARRAAESQP